MEPSGRDEPRYTARAELISEHEPHRAVMLVMADRLNATVRRITDTMYHSADEFLDDLRVVQRSLAACGAVRAAYGPVQTIIWQVESFGFHMVEMEFRQHSRGCTPAPSRISTRTVSMATCSP